MVQRPTESTEGADLDTEQPPRELQLGSLRRVGSPAGHFAHERVEGDRMKAAVCRAFNEPLVIEELTIEEPQAGELLVDVKACAICHSDITYMDGGWYRVIMTIGYPNGPLPEFSTSWPFSPLYPFVADLLNRLGVPVGPSLILVSWIFALVALVGIWELTSQRFGKTVAQSAVWCLALLPGAVGMVLSYSDSMFAAGLVWMLVAIDRIVAKNDTLQQRADRGWWVVGLISLVVTASRPNGILVLVAVVCAIWMSQRKMINLVAATLPSLIFFLSSLFPIYRIQGRH